MRSVWKSRKICFTGFFGTDVSTSNEAVTVICPDIQNGVGGTWFFLVAVHFIFVGVGVATQ